MEIKHAKAFAGEVVTLLQAFNLPVNDLPAGLENFYVMADNDKALGVIGIEVYGDYGLLRSLAVNKDFQGTGIAGRLVEMIESVATDKSIKGIYLLTETAPDYFKRKGYGVVLRSEVASPVQQSTEFKETCPLSAIVMLKTISAGL